MNEDEWNDFIRDGSEQRLIWYAEGGDFTPLKEHLENGGDIGPGLRRYFVQLLDGTAQKRPGVPAVKKTRDRNSEVARLIWMRAKFGNDGSRMSLYRAKQEYLDQHPDMNPDTLDTICRQWGVTAESLKNQ